MLAIETRELDLGRREADLAIRTGGRREPSLIYRSLGTLGYGLYASLDYLARRGAPRSERDLAKHDVIGFAGPAEKLPIMRWLRDRGVARFAFRATSYGAFLLAARAGLGIAALPGDVGDELRRVLARARPTPLPVALVCHRDARRLPHVRAFAAAPTASSATCVRMRRRITWRARSSPRGDEQTHARCQRRRDARGATIETRPLVRTGRVRPRPTTPPS